MSLRATTSAQATLKGTAKRLCRPCVASSSRRCLATPAPRPTSDPSSSTLPPFVLPEIHLGQTHLARYHEHYDSSLASDLMYIHYDHRFARLPPPPPPELRPLTPYEANRPAPNVVKPQKAKVTTSTNVPRLEEITIQAMSKKAVQNKYNLLPVVMALRAISADSADGGGRGKSSSGVQILKAKNGCAPWRLREGMPIAAKVTIRGEAMYDFIESIVDFVLPRLREFRGFEIKEPAGPRANNAQSGAVTVGFTETAMALLPQIEPFVDQYPHLSGFDVSFKTNAQGPRAQVIARSVLSGLRIPFARI